LYGQAAQLASARHLLGGAVAPLANSVVHLNTRTTGPHHHEIAPRAQLFVFLQRGNNFGADSARVPEGYG
jgi:hypothetical protein